MQKASIAVSICSACTIRIPIPSHAESTGRNFGMEMDAYGFFCIRFTKIKTLRAILIMHYAENLVSMPDQKASILSLFS